jgi:hypothetical protein
MESREVNVEERNEKLQMPAPISLVWEETPPGDGKWLSWCTATCSVCSLEARGYTILGAIHDPCGEEWIALNELEAKGCPHCEPARTVVDLLDLESP